MATDASDQSVDAGPVRVTVEDVGGIDRADVSITPGVTVFRGRNATNRTSFLSAVAGSLGGSSGSLKSDAGEGSVVLQMGDQRYTRTFRRTEDSVRVGGEPYVEDASLVDTFVALLEDNPARRAVERGDDLRDIIMRPVDTDGIERRIDSLRAESERLADRIEEVRERKERLPALEDRRRSLESELASVDERIESLREEITAYESDQPTAAEADTLVEELEDARGEHTRVESEIEVIEAEIGSLESEIDELEGDADTEYTDEELEDVKEELAVARERRRQLDETTNALHTIVEFNRDLLEGSLELPGIEPAESGPVTELAPEDERELVCWTCGSRVTRREVDERLDALREVVDEKRAERTDVEQRVTELEERREAIEGALAERERVSQERETLRNRLEEKHEHLSTLQSRETELTERIADLETEVAETQQLRDDELLEMYEEVSDCQYERGQLQQRLDDLREDIEEIESLPAVEDLAAERDDLRERIARERARIERLERRAVETFNREMDDLLDVLAYENIARVWIERLTDEPGPDADSTLELHVVREGTTGTSYEETVDNLSESERELIGLVFALAGYLSHEVHEDVPFLLLDSLEAMDSERIGSLVEHFAEYADILLVALLPEDARAVSDRHERIDASVLR
ncbi:archaea-specific SMC-related protein [Halorhabdus amylolytica]|uniref:archaea-specific SMC-related protein n=1 Tax=Halorhabdus amylolytica TaxID=2559573 RepID=UPI0010AAE973|nr:archaea-specific SMC-related protein [Halorhabdus amylolytica]